MSSYICSICPRRCNAVRDDDRGGGFCEMPAAPVVARAALHFGEEPCISGTRGSGTVFFSGCSLKCCFCQNQSISHKNEGKPITVERLAEIFKELEIAGAHNINLVNPSHYAVSISKAFITLGIGDAKFIKTADIAIKAICATTLIADIIGFYLFVC